MNKNLKHIKLVPLVAAIFSSTWASAAGNIIIQDNFTGAKANLDWTSKTGACLTAGNGTGTIPKCAGLAYYSGVTLKGGETGTLPDTVGNGALRFTNNTNNQTGAIVSNFTFPSSSGLAVTFATVSYAGTGADGISFFLMDGSKPAGVGAEGGSLAYSCSNTNNVYDGLIGAYLGLGMDEYGNFLNKSDNASTGYGFQAGRVGLRGAGNTAWSWLNQNYSTYYPSSLSSSQRQTAVKKTCSTGNVWDYSNPSSPQEVKTPGTTIPIQQGNINWSYLSTNFPQYYPSNSDFNKASEQKVAIDKTKTTNTLWDFSNGRNNPKEVITIGNSIPLNNYAVIPNAYKVLPANQPIYTSATIRPNAVPIVYQLKITQDSRLSLSYSYNGGTLQPILTDQSILDSNGIIPESFRFGFSGSTGGSNNIHEVTCFRAEPADGSASSAGINTQQSGEVKTGTQVYLAYYHRNNWWGQLASRNLVYNSATNNGTVSISPTANWDASCVLTGGSCEATGANTIVQDKTNRNIITFNGINGIPFLWDSLTSSQQSALGESGRLDYLRGGRTGEIATNGDGDYRARTSILGDIIDSSPAWVGPPSAPYTMTAWKDAKIGTLALLPENAALAQKYSAFITAKKTRLNVTYVGANDGFLHGFRAGSYNAAGNYISNTTTPNDGREVLAYMPSTIVNSIYSSTTTQDYSSSQYAHSFNVDGTPSTGDLFYNNAWHTWLVGGLGPGGKAVYALDVTDPATFSEDTASSIVMKEWSSSSISCVNNTGCGSNMGDTYGTPQIRRFHNGQWGFVFGNGLNSATGKAGIYVVTIDPSSTTVPPAMNVYYLDTGSGTITSKNGITYTTPADLDQDHVTDYVYAGDVQGNVWRFDLTSATASDWSVSKYGNTTPTPLFKTGTGQPVTTQVQVAIVPAATGKPRVIVQFGTGQQTVQTVSSAATYASAAQTLYGIWDWEMSGWTSLEKLPATGALTPIANSTLTANLQSQTVTGTYAATTTNGVSGYRTVSNSKVCWQGSTVCAANNNKYGWKLNLPSSGEQVIYSPILSQGAFIVNTTIPAEYNPLSCTAGSNTGWTMAINPETGGAFTKSFFGDVNNNFVNISGGPVSGIQIGAVGSPSVVTAGGSPFLVNQTGTGTGNVSKILPPGGTIGGRVTWQQIR